MFGFRYVTVGSKVTWTFRLKMQFMGGRDLNIIYCSKSRSVMDLKVQPNNKHTMHESDA